LGCDPGPGEFGRPDRSPEWLSSCGGQGHRYGVRALSTLEGYVDRNRETELASLRRAHDHRPGFRLRLERWQTRSSINRASVRLCGQYAAQGENSPKGLRAAEGLGSSRVLA
jgi:hypothetical protein